MAVKLSLDVIYELNCSGQMRSVKNIPNETTR